MHASKAAWKTQACHIAGKDRRWAFVAVDKALLAYRCLRTYPRGFCRIWFENRERRTPQPSLSVYLAPLLSNPNRVQEGKRALISWDGGDFQPVSGEQPAEAFISLLQRDDEAVEVSRTFT